MERWDAGAIAPSCAAESAASLVQALDGTDRVEEICSTYQKFIEDFGFRSAVCMTLPGSTNFDQDRILMSTRPKPFQQAYLSKGLYRFDPVVKEVRRRREAFSWSEMRKARRLTRQEREVLRHAGTFGLNSGFVIPVRESGGNVGFVDIAGPQAVRLGEDRRAALILAAIYVYHRLCSLRPAATEPPRELTTREVETLRWIARGKSDWQVGQILGISEKTVNYHIENVKRKFGVATRIQAVVAAIERQSCRIDEPVQSRSTGSRR